MSKIIERGGFIVAHHKDYLLIRNNENFVEINKTQLIEILKALILTDKNPVFEEKVQ